MNTKPAAAERPNISDANAKASEAALATKARSGDSTRHARTSTTSRPGMLARSTWEHEYCNELERLDTLDRQISRTETMDRVVARERERSFEHDLGIEL